MSSAVNVLGIAAVTCLAACSSNSEHIDKLRAALDKAELSLADSVVVAEAETTDGIGIRAALVVDADTVFSVGAMANSALQNVRVDIVTGEVLSMKAGNLSSATCPGSIALTEAIAVAEAAAGGEAVAIQPDDDGQCNREVTVLTGDTLWEVKVGPNGSIVENQEADDEEEGDD